MSTISNLSTPTTKISKGLEQATFSVSPIHTAMHAISRVAEDGEQAVNRLLCGWYTFRPRPEPEDILLKKIMPNMETGKLDVTLTIRRGALALASILTKHKDVKVLSYGGFITATCQKCNRQWEFLDEAFSSTPNIFSGDV